MKKTHVTILALAAVSLIAASALPQQILEKEKGLYTTPDQKASVAMGAQGSILIKSAVSLSGTLEIRAADTKTVSVTYTKQARADSRSKGVDYIDLISVALDEVAGQVKLELRAPNPGPWNKETEAGIVGAVVTVPTLSRIEVDATQFDVTVVGPLKGLVVRPSFGKMDISKITEKLDVSTANRRVALDDIAGDITVSTTNASIMASSIVSGSGPARFRNDGGDIKIDGCTGIINVKSSYGRVDILNFEPRGEASFVRGNSGPISIDIKQMGKARLVVSNQLEDIEIMVPDTVSAAFSLAVDGDGDIEATNFPFKTDLVERDRLNLHARKGDAEISSSVRGKGNIYIRGVKGE